MKVTAGKIVGVIISLIMVLVLFSMLPNILPSVINSVNTLFGTDGLNNATLVGTGPASFASNVSTYLGWFWVVSPFVLVIGVILALFLRGKGRR